MARKAKELSALQVGRLTSPGNHAVGGVSGLYLYVNDADARSWVLRIMVGTKRRHMGLGGFPDVPLARAREKARAARDEIDQGIDPIAQRKAAGKRADAARQQDVVVFDRSNPLWPHAASAETLHGYDAVFDPLGGASLNRSFRLLAPTGVLVMLGAATAVQSEGNGLVKILGSLARFVALKLRPDARKVRMFIITRSKKSRPAEFHADFATLLDWLGQGKIDPTISLRLPLKDAARAYDLLERSAALGKIILIP